MGLDMYLKASDYITRVDYNRTGHEVVRTINEKFNTLVDLFDMKEHIDSDNAGIEVTFPMGYWRKANAIHNWFVKELAGGKDECQTIYVNRDHLEQLKTLCQLVLAVPVRAEELLPTASGFFFGSTAYDEYYMDDLEETINIINRCLNSKFDYFQYQASW